MKKMRWLGLPAAAALAVVVFALTAGIGSARTTAAPSNTTPPKISGTPQVGQQLTTDNGNWNGTTPFTYAYQWRVCDQNGANCHDITGATTNQYTVASGDQGNTLRVVVTAKNSDGTDSSTSVPTASVTAGSGSTGTGTTTSGCPKLAAGASSVAIADVASPARLQITGVTSNPSVITRGTGLFTVTVHVSDTCGDPVQGAQVYMTGVPYHMVSIPTQQTSDANGSVSVQMKTMAGFPATPRQQLLVLFVRASRQGDPVLAGISTRRLVSLRVNLHG
jgi:hypothetical protein